MDGLDFDNPDDMFSGDSGGGGSGNSGMHLELLMNNNSARDNSSKYFGKGGGASSTLEEVTDFNRKLDNLDHGSGSGEGRYQPQSSMFGAGGGSGDNVTFSLDGGGGGGAPRSIQFNEQPDFIDDQSGTGNAPPGLAAGNWDNLQQFNDIPGSTDPPKRLSEEQTLRRKIELLRKFDFAENQRGVKFLKKYTIADNLWEMEAEYDAIMAESKRQRGVNSYKNYLLVASSLLEEASGMWNPFENVDIQGFTSELEEAIHGDDYEEVFEALQEKYKDTLKLMPELRLMGMVGMSMVMYSGRRMKRKMAGLPGGAGTLHQRNAAALNQYPDANSLTQEQMMRAMMQQNSMEQSAANGGGPPHPQYLPPGMPAPVPNYAARADPRGGNNSQGERYAARIPAPGSSAAEVTAHQAQTLPPHMQPMSMTPRAEMNGPRDINNILSGLRTRQLSAPISAAAPNPYAPPPMPAVLHPTATSTASQQQPAAEIGPQPRSRQRKRTADAIQL